MSGVNLQDKQKEIAFFDAQAASAEYDVFTPQSNSRLIAAFVPLSELPRGSRVADLGCGSGVFTDLLRHEGYASAASTSVASCWRSAGANILDSFIDKHGHDEAVPSLRANEWRKKLQ
jgi:SAM-dependent methyltransferase